MKLAILPLVALSLIVTIPAGSQGVPPVTDSSQGDNLPRTQQERDLNLEGQPRGQLEQPAPDKDDEGNRETDDDTDIVPGMRRR